MNLAHNLLVEEDERVFHVRLEKPLTLYEIRDHFAKSGRLASIILQKSGEARVFFGEPIYPSLR